ncbi:DivIVA family protein [Mycobacteroides abscessus subsp. abscessus]|nr:DivIVA family protein [Mycobacteroides abscessus subsp. abscessus]
MAQKVHDDYVLEGQREKDRLLAEGREEASSLLTSAQEERAQVLGDLDATKSSLESSVAQLRQFEQQYRSGLRAYLEDQLVGLESTPLVESEIVQHNN